MMMMMMMIMMMLMLMLMMMTMLMLMLMLMMMTMHYRNRCQGKRDPPNVSQKAIFICIFFSSSKFSKALILTINFPRKR